VIANHVLYSVSERVLYYDVRLDLLVMLFDPTY